MGYPPGAVRERERLHLAQLIFPNRVEGLIQVPQHVEFVVDDAHLPATVAISDQRGLLLAQTG